MEEAGRAHGEFVFTFSTPKASRSLPGCVPVPGLRSNAAAGGTWSISALLSFGSPLPRSGDLGVIVYGFPANAV